MPCSRVLLVEMVTSKQAIVELDLAKTLGQH